MDNKESPASSITQQRIHSEQQSSISKKRWQMLTNFIQKIPQTDISISTRRFRSFELVEYLPVENWPDTPIYSYRKILIPTSCTSPEVIVRLLLGNDTNITDLAGFDSTGNVCVWPSEEAMALFIMKNQQLIRDRKVIELGAGMTGLAGLFASKTSESVVITDGNDKTVENLHQICLINRLSNCSSRFLRWDSIDADLISSADVLLCSDCFFFDDSRPILLKAVIKLLTPRGKAYLFAPSRNGTFEQFVKLAEKIDHLLIEISEDYDTDMSVKRRYFVSRSHLNGYDDDLHYPRLLRLLTAVQYTVGKICDEQEQKESLSFSKEVISQITQLTFDCVSKDWAADLQLFARHAKRSSINADDVKLLVRKNPSLVCTMSQNQYSTINKWYLFSVSKLDETTDQMMAKTIANREQLDKKKHTKKNSTSMPAANDDDGDKATRCVQSSLYFFIDSFETLMNAADWDAIDNLGSEYDSTVQEEEQLNTSIQMHNNGNDRPSISNHQKIIQPIINPPDDENTSRFNNFELTSLKMINKSSKPLATARLDAGSHSFLNRGKTTRKAPANGKRMKSNGKNDKHTGKKAKKPSIESVKPPRISFLNDELFD